VSSDVTPVVVLSKNESPGLELVLILSTDTSMINSNVSPSDFRISWFKRAHQMGELQLT
jgi:hypothetical protein